MIQTLGWANKDFEITVTNMSRKERGNGATNLKKGEVPQRISIYKKYFLIK